MLQIRVGAKINWTLDITGKRVDGYHELDMLMHSITLQDVLCFAPAEELSLDIQGGSTLAARPDNLVLRAAHALHEAGGARQGAQITLQKHIPMSAGMGGGSGDAAAALVGLSRLWGLTLPHKQMMEIAVSLGADVPFFLHGGLQRAKGVGEKLSRVRYARDFWLVVIHPCRGLSTKDVFAAMDLNSLACRPHNDTAQAALSRGDLPALSMAMGNVMQPVAERLRPEIAQAVASLRAYGAVAAQMTGSGCAVFGAFPQARSARVAWKALHKEYRRCYMARTSRQAMEIIDTAQEKKGR